MDYRYYSIKNRFEYKYDKFIERCFLFLPFLIRYIKTKSKYSILIKEGVIKLALFPFIEIIDCKQTSGQLLLKRRVH